MAPTAPDVPYLERRQIEDHASEVLRAAGYSEPPISAYALAYRAGVSVDFVDFDDEAIAGQIMREGDQADILVRDADPEYRKNFTVAHELGHFFLHPNQDWSDDEVTMYRHAYRAEDVGVDRAEFQANAFAAALLMPEEPMRRLWNKFQSVNYLRPILMVSKSAIIRRLSELGIVVPSVKGTYYLGLEPLARVSATPKAPPLADEKGVIPSFPPLRLDERGRIIAMGEAEIRARQEALGRVLDAIDNSDREDPPGLAEKVMREIDEGRPHRKLFEGL
jgi:Zn-dependent peptidase ImmA (M78 family)